MKQMFVAVLAACTVAAVLTGGVWAAPEYPIDYVIAHASDLQNKSVTVEGLVQNSQVAQTNPLDEVAIKGQFDLQDKSGTITVQTTQPPPANGKRMRVTGTLTNGADGPMIMMTGRTLEGMGLWIALGALGVLAVVLVLLLFRQPKGKTQPGKDKAVLNEPPIVAPTGRAKQQASGAAMPGTGVGGQRVCPKCKASSPSDARFCEACGESFESRAQPTVPPSASRSRAAETILPPRSRDGEPIADLVVVEGPGLSSGQSFRLGGVKQKIGREDVDIMLSDPSVSRQHCVVWCENGGFYIQEEPTCKAGVLINGQKVTRQELKDNDQIALGQTKLVFRLIKPTGPTA